MTRTRVLIAIFILIVGGALTVLFLRFQSVHKPTLQIGTTRITVDLAESPAAREQGLSGRTALGRKEGMLFIFPEPGTYGFWMKDMLFPIDIIWIDSNWRVIGTSPNLAPETFPEGFYPPSPAQYVLEVPSGFSTVEAVSIGSAVSLKR
jgi:uncharacterized protein